MQICCVNKGVLANGRNCLLVCRTEKRHRLTVFVASGMDARGCVACGQSHFGFQVPGAQLRRLRCNENVSIEIKGQSAKARMSYCTRN